MFRLIFLIFLLLPLSVGAQMTTCKLTYTMSGWSFVYKEYKGHGVVHCHNGQSARVSLISRGGGMTLGRSDIIDGHGLITSVNSINEVYGTYVYLDGHAGATRSVDGSVMTKGIVSLVLGGTGRGFDLGVAIGALTIKPE